MQGTDNRLEFHVSRVPALDGIRAIAILLVFAVHTTPILLKGGRVGVDLFFVLSGFLITSMLLQEYRDTGRIHLGHFYMRRVLRLFPALLLVVAAVIAYTYRTSGADMMQLTLHDAVGVLFYFFNWQIVSLFPNYLDHQWMFSHLWSLSIEEQFYLIWPVVLLTMLVRGASRKALIGVAIAGIVLPWVLRSTLWSFQHSMSIYFRTDTHCDGLAWGALEAMLIHFGYVPNANGRKDVQVASGSGLVLLLLIASIEGMKTGFFYTMGFTLVGLGSAALIYGSVVAPVPYLTKALEFAPLRWIGRISYGLYLWHWPIIRVVSTKNLPPLESAVIEFALIFAVASASFYFYEKPFLRLKQKFSPAKEVSERQAALVAPAAEPEATPAF